MVSWDVEVEGRQWRRNALSETCDIALPSFYVITWSTWVYELFG